MKLSAWNVLSDAEIAVIHQKSLEILQKAGIRVMDVECRRLLAAAGAKIGADGERVFLPQKLVEEHLPLAPSSFNLYRADETPVRIGTDTRVFGSLVIDPWIMDYPTQKPRRPRLEDVVRHARIGEAHPSVGFIYRMEMPPEGMEEEIAYVRTLEAVVCNTTKPLLAAPASPETLENWLEIAEILSDGRSVGEKPRVMMGAPVTTPLTIHPLNARIMKECIRRGLPFCAQTEPIAGTTAPLSFAGGILSANCENLFLLTLSQVLKPGAAVAYSAGNALAEMKAGRVIFYNADKILWKIAACQMAGFYHVPIEAEATGSMVGRHDTQNGIESALLMLPAALRGGGMFNGLGSCYNACGLSSEMIVMHADLICLLGRISEGIEVSDRTLDAESILSVGPGGSFLTEPLTIEQLRSGEFYTGGCFDRLGEQSPNRHEDSMLARAHERAEQLSSQIPAVSEKTAAEIRRWADQKAR
ncbi:MAG: trimethylamine methyltransferase family protein [Verrucomicrobia bacterium]|nr:trimethylamine methyltransferase family protein [Verrucomicrobiota bacterium]